MNSSIISKESLSFIAYEGESQLKTVIDKDIYLPENLPDIKEISILTAEVQSNDVEFIDKTAKIKGTILYKLLYKSLEEDRRTYLEEDDGNDNDNSTENTTNLFNHTAAEEFNVNLQLPKEVPIGQISSCQLSIEHLDYSLDNSRKINIRALVRFQCRVYKNFDLEIIQNISESSEIETQTANVDICCSSDVIDEQFDIIENFSLPEEYPPVEEILWYSIKLIEKKEEFSEEGLNLTGTYKLSVLYIDEIDNELTLFEKEAAFVSEINNPNINEDTILALDFSFVKSSISIEEDSDGESMIFKMTLTGKVKGEIYNSKYLEYIKDAYGLKKQINIETEEVQLKEYLASINNKLELTEYTDIEDNIDVLRKIISFEYTPCIFTNTVHENYAEIDGCFHIHLLYCPQDNLNDIRSMYWQIPFNLEISNEKFNSDNIIIDTFFNSANIVLKMLPNNELECRIIADVRIIVSQKTILKFLTDLEETEEEINTSNSSIVIYFTKNDDTLWGIAKKFKTPVKNLIKLNELSEDTELHPGMKLILWG